MDTGVSFIIIPAKKGFQAASVTIADPPKEEPVPTQETTGFGTDDAWGSWGTEAPSEEKAPADKPTADTGDAAWGAWGEAVEEEKVPTDKPTEDDAWGVAVEENKAPANKSTADTAHDASGAWGEAVEEEKAPTDTPTADTADDAWGEPVTQEAVTPHKDSETPPEKAMEDVHLSDTNEQSIAATDGEWGSGGW